MRWRALISFVAKMAMYTTLSGLPLACLVFPNRHGAVHSNVALDAFWDHEAQLLFFISMHKFEAVCYCECIASLLTTLIVLLHVHSVKLVKLVENNYSTGQFPRHCFLISNDSPIPTHATNNLSNFFSVLYKKKFQYCVILHFFSILPGTTNIPLNYFNAAL